MAATIACHAAVKANYPLTYEKMAHILEEVARDGRNRASARTAAR